MANILEKEKTPDWLMSIVNDTSKFIQPIPLQDLLKNSLYYPCSWFDSKPINSFTGYISSFVYVDISVNLKQHKEWIRNGFKQATGESFNSVNGKFSLVIERKVGWDEIIPRGWVPNINPTPQDGDSTSLLQWERDAPPHFAYWTIWRREDAAFNSEGNPDYFSLLYFGGCEMNAVYQATYNRQSLKPKVLTLINPGMGFWDSFGAPTYTTHSFFGKVLKANPAGLPPYLYCGGNGTYLSFRPLYENLNSPDFGSCSSILKLKEDWIKWN